MMQKQNWKLLAKYLSGECTEYEMAKVEIWRKSDSKNEQFIKNMSILWKSNEPKISITDPKILWDKLSQKAKINNNLTTSSLKNKKKSIFRKIDWNFFSSPAWGKQLGYAVVATLMLVVFFLVHHQVGNKPITEISSSIIIAKAAKTKTKKVVLPDGTSVFLDSGSLLKYPIKFSLKKREVYLEGNGYFEVSDNAKKPFVINTHNSFVQVLGTKFYVTDWPKYKKSEVGVLEGKVLFNSKRKNLEDGVILKKNSYSLLHNSKKPTKPILDDVRKRFNWKNHERKFKNASLDEIFSQLKNWYGVTFKYKDPSIKSRLLTIHFDEAASFKNKLENVVRLAKLSYKQVGNEYWIDK